MLQSSGGEELEKLSEIQGTIEESCAKFYPNYGSPRWRQGDETCMYDLLTACAAQSQWAGCLFSTKIRMTQFCMIHKGVVQVKERNVVALEISCKVAGGISEITKGRRGIFSIKKAVGNVFISEDAKKCQSCGEFMRKGEEIIGLPTILVVILLRSNDKQHFTIFSPNAISLRGYVILDEEIKIGDASFALRAVHMATGYHHTCHFKVDNTWFSYDDLHVGKIDEVGNSLDIEDTSLISSVFYERCNVKRLLPS